MAISAIAYSYWRKIKTGQRTWATIPSATMRGDVNMLAMQDLANGIITADQYAQWIGIPTEA